MRDVFAQVRFEQDVHRAADTHLARNRQVFMFSHQRIAPICADQVFRANSDFLAGHTIQAGRRHAVAILNVAQIFSIHPRVAAALTSGLEQQGFHEGLRQIVHKRRAAHQMFGFGQGMRAPAFHTTYLFACEAFAKDVLAHQLLLGGKKICLLFDLMAEIAQHLHRALVGDMRTRCVGKPAIAIDHHILDPVTRQKRG